MRFTTAKILLCLLAASMLISCSRGELPARGEEAGSSPSASSASSEESEPQDAPSEDTPKKEFDPLALGVLGHTQGNGPLTAQPLEADSTIADGLAVPAEQLGEQLRVCVYDPQGAGYVVHDYDWNQGDTVGQLIRTALDRLDLPLEGLELASVRVEKGFAASDFSLEEGSPAAQTLSDRESVETLLNTVSATLTGNGFYRAGFLLNGGAFSLGGVTLEDDGYGGWDAPALWNQPISSEEFTQLRALIPCPGFRPLSESLLSHNRETAAEYPRLYELVARAGDTGPYQSPGELGDEAKRKAALGMTRDVYSFRYNPESSPLYPDDDRFLEPLIRTVGDESLTFQEWVEAAVEELWGPGTTVIHGSIDIGYTYHPEEGVYTPPHRGGGVVVEPYLHQVDQTPEGYTARVSYLTIGMGSVKDENGEWVDLPQWQENDPVVRELLTQRLPRYEVTAVYGEDGQLYLQSSRLLEE